MSSGGVEKQILKLKREGCRKRVGPDKDGWNKLAKNLKANIDGEKIEAFKETESIEFKQGKTIAVKIIDDRGIKSLRVKNL
jgi:adenine-specific DNA-methyltransferase